VYTGDMWKKYIRWRLGIVHWGKKLWDLKKITFFEIMLEAYQIIFIEDFYALNF
jgi:hypothetical protein